MNIRSRHLVSEIPSILLVAVLSGGISLIIILPFALIYRLSYREFLQSFCIGFFLGILAYSVFHFFYRNMMKFPVISFLAVFVTIALGSTAACIWMNVPKILYTVGVVSFSELSGLILAWIFYRRSVQVNRKLHETQEKIRKENAGQDKSEV